MSYVTVKIPKELIDQIDKLIEKHIGGYTSRPDLIKEAIRIRLQEVRHLFPAAAAEETSQPPQ